uniref:Genome polyprotein n=1 Tax=Soybean thrips virus 2 TaxID=2796561 RepID=A0A7T3UZ38_9FLAV|nr:NS3-like protein [Soybean thrips virus 2]
MSAPPEGGGDEATEETTVEKLAVGTRFANWETMFNSTMTFWCGFVVACSIDFGYIPGWLASIVWFLASDVLLRNEVSEIRRWFWRWSGVGILALTNPYLVFLTGVMSVTPPGATFISPEPFFWEYVQQFRNTCDVGMDAPLFGAHNLESLGLRQFIEGIKGDLEEWITCFEWYPKVTCKRLRDLDISVAIRDISEVVPVTAKEVKTFVRSAQARNKFGVTLAVVIMCIVFQAYPGLGVIALILLLAKKDKDEEAITATPSKPSISDGVYHLRYVVCGYTVSESIGVVTGGVMHACYHAVSAQKLQYGSRTWDAVYTSKDRDLTTWFGPPVMARVNAGEEIFINAENEIGRATYKTTPSVDETGSIAWPGQTVPGESGSPVFVRRDGVLHLVGLAGSWAKMDGKVVEYATPPVVTTDSVPRERINRVVMHPGAGKTRNRLPTLVAQALTEPRAKIVVTGPTRIVCKELFEALQKQWPGQVSYEVSGSTDRAASKKIVVMAHATLWSRIVREHRSIQGMTHLVVDEAHVLDSTTMAIVKWIEYQPTLKVWLMSATLGSECNRGSNFPIDDIKIDESDVLDVVMREIEDGMRVMLFVPSVDGKGGVNEWSAKIRKLQEEREKVFGIVKLSRSTFDTAHGMLADPDKPLIVTTNIAECGLNADVDVVVDTSKRFGYFHDGTDVTAQVVTINEASHIQRRGRCGRFKRGTYYYVEEPKEYVLRTAEEYDSLRMLSTMSIPDGIGVPLTRPQLRTSLASSISPDVTCLITNAAGQPEKKQTLEIKVQQWLSGAKKQQCGKGVRGCMCTDSPMAWFDDRHHDLLVKILRGEGVGKQINIERNV